MKDVQKFRSFVELLARQHADVQHTDTSIHFACTLDDADNAYARTMHYPAVVLDLGDMNVNPNLEVGRNVTLMFLDHVKDTGSERQKTYAFDRTADIALQFLAQMERTADTHPEHTFLSRIEISGAQLFRVELQEAGLYGWVVSLQHTFSMRSVVCQKVFGSDFEYQLSVLFTP